MPDVWLGIDVRTSETFDLDDHFQHSSAIAYSAISSSPDVATATIKGSMLTVTAADTGGTRVVVTATAEGKSVEDGFEVEVHYTNPYTMGEIDDLELTVGDVKDVSVRNSRLVERMARWRLPCSATSPHLGHAHLMAPPALRKLPGGTYTPDRP